jgi:glycosyltransferase involved in cell wall biosynthesis
LARAVRSVRAQITDFEVEIIVVNDSHDESFEPPLPVDQLLWTGGGRKGGHTRNRGVAASRGSLVAFLDDDDEWLPLKLAQQVEAHRVSVRPESTVISGRHVHVREGVESVSRPGPDVLIRPGQSVTDYLFRRRLPQVGRASMYTSTLLAPRELAVSIPWREDLSRHQDWDWLARLEQDGGVRFQQIESVVVRIQTGSRSSISASADWEASKAWADDVLGDDPSYTDFVVGQTLRYALNARSVAGVKAIVEELTRRRTLPSLGPTILGLAGAVPRSELERMMTFRRPNAARMDATVSGGGS